MKRLSPTALLLFATAALLASSIPPAKVRAAETKSPDRQPATDLPALDHLLPRLAPLSPQEALKTFRIEKGFKIELAAAEPNVTDPADIAFDENGRMYVCELWNYPGVPKPGEPLGRIRLLESTRGDGVYDRSTVFADNVMWPGGIACWDGGVFVCSSPDIWYFKDTTGSGKADVRRKVYTGFKGQTYEIVNSLRWGIDNRIYVCGSYAGGSIVPADSKGAEPANGRDFRFDTRRSGAEVVAGSGEFGNTFDDFGGRFTCDATHIIYHAVLPREYLARNPYLLNVPDHENPYKQWAEVYPISPPEPWKAVREQFWSKWKDTSGDMRAGRFPPTELAPHGYATSAAGITLYRGSAYPDGYRGNAFIGEPANNVVVRLTVKREGVGVTARRPGEGEKHEFLASTDNQFRPVNFANGPDGCLYVVSMYREVIEDATAIPDDILKRLDLYSGRDRGRVYRIAPENFRRPDMPHLGTASVEELIAVLARPDGWWRDTAQRLLYQRHDKSAIGPLRTLARGAELPQSRVQALWTLEGLGGLDEPTLLAAIADPRAEVREHAIRLSEKLLASSAALRAKVLASADDPDARVRFQAALSLQLVRDEMSLDALARIARRDDADQWTRLAVLCASPERAGALFGRLVEDRQFMRSPQAEEFLGRLAEIVGTRNQSAEIGTVLGAIASPAMAERENLRRTAVRQVAAGLSRSGNSLANELRDGGDTSVRAVLDRLFIEARQTAADLSKNVGDRVEAVQLLSYAPYESAAAALTMLLEPTQPQAVQLAAVRALSAQSEPSVAKLLVQHWRGFGPSVRPDVEDALFRRPERLPALLDAIEAKKVPPGELMPARRQALLKAAEPAIRARAEKLFSSQAAGSRRPVIDRYRTAMAKLTGDPKRGATVFETNCSICHRAAGIGNAVGPDLAALDDRSPDTLLINTLDPNRDVKPIYVNYDLQTRDGQFLSGVIATETATGVTLRRPGGGEDTVPRRNIKSLRSTGLSLMPDGLEAGVDQQQMADLIRFLQELKKE